MKNENLLADDCTQHDWSPDNGSTKRHPSNLAAMVIVMQ